MFGYLQPDLPYLYLKDDKLYKSLYCGVCKSIGSCCSQASRLSLTYDVAFLSAIAHNILGIDVEIKNKRCIAHPFVPRPVAMRDDLTDMMAGINVILAHYKVVDDVTDGKKSIFKRMVVRRGYKRAKKKLPEIDKIVSFSYTTLRECEKKQVESIDMVSDSFALMLHDLSAFVLKDKATENTNQLFYFLGKWIYLIDALDDYDKDLKNKNYNPFYCAFKKQSFSELLKEHGQEISLIFNDIFTSIAFNFDKIEFKFNKDLVANILLRGIPQKTKSIVERSKNE